LLLVALQLAFAPLCPLEAAVWRDELGPCPVFHVEEDDDGG